MPRLATVELWLFGQHARKVDLRRGSGVWKGVLDGFSGAGRPALRVVKSGLIWGLDRNVVGSKVQEQVPEEVPLFEEDGKSSWA